MTRYLIVDDSPTIRLQLQDLLTKLGVLGGDIFTANDGHEALAAFQEHKVDVVFMDISMPNQDGLETTQKLLQQQPDLKVVVVTGLSRQDPASMKLIMEGAYAFIEKPLEMEDVRKVIKKIEMGRGGAGRIMSSD